MAGKNVKKAVKDIEAQTTADGAADIIGFKVWWDLHHATGARADIETALKNAGIEWAMPEELSPEQRLRHAGGTAGRKQGVDFKSAGREGEWTTYRPVKFAKAKDGKGNGAQSLTVDPKVLTSISVNREDGKITLQDGSCEVGKAVAAAYAALDGQFVPFQVRQVIKAVLEGELHGIRIKRNGGLYYIPADTEVETTLRELQTMVQNIGSCDLYVEQVAAGSDTARAATRGTMRSLDGQYAELLGAAREFAAKLESGDLVNGRSLSSRLESATQLKRKAELYTSILDDRGAKLSKAVGIVSATVRSVVEASVDVRALSKAKESERARELARKLIKDIASSAKKDLAKAEKMHAPETDDSEADDE
jgi:hypothetical protein